MIESQNIKSRLVSLEKTNYFSPLILDYTSNDSKVKPFFQLPLSKENLYQQASIKSHNYKHRNTLYKAIQKQMNSLNLSSLQRLNLEKLSRENTFTVTTGHQLNLFTGPVFFFYKILHAIKMVDELNANYADKYFVPIYWMATEDHDFAEINHFWQDGRKFSWEKETSGAVGNISTAGLEDIEKVFLSYLPDQSLKIQLKTLFENAYLKHDNLTDATRFLVNELFSQYGLLILDGNDKSLKSLMIPYFEKELKAQFSYEKVLNSNAKLEALGYKIQVHPREINLFYLSKNLRERIVEENGNYVVLNTDLKFTQEEILNELHQFPEKFSPNVILRPLFQEVILPNIAYIGGGGEIAYWLQLKEMFIAQGIDFPILTLRNSFLIQSRKLYQKQQKLGIEDDELFLSIHNLIKSKVEKISDLQIDFNGYERQLENIFAELNELAKRTDVTLGNMIKAQETKQLKGMFRVKQRWLKAEIRKNAELKSRLEELHNALFPNGQLQERVENFSTFWLAFGENFIGEIYQEIKPFSYQFTIAELD